MSGDWLFVRVLDWVRRVPDLVRLVDRNRPQ
jgi:hypothetical protein